MIFNTVFPTPFARPTTDLRRVNAAVYLKKKGKAVSPEGMLTYVLNDRGQHNSIFNKWELLFELMNNPFSILPEIKESNLFEVAITLRDLIQNPVCSYNSLGELEYNSGDELDDPKFITNFIGNFKNEWRDNSSLKPVFEIAFPN